MFRKLLVANRGEIAVRVLQAAQELAIRTAAVYSDPDRDALHVQAADEAYPLGGKTAMESYLSVEKIVRIAREIGADAVHPGYGFLSENPELAGALEAAGIAFVGPPSSVIRALGDKLEAKRIAREAGVPVVPGSEVADPSELPDAAAAVGYPLLVKAAAGGGGKGMRLVASPEELSAAMESAAREARSAFGDPRVFLERALEQPRHVEVQILADARGDTVHLFERECSIQRRHQKIVEESPSPAVTPRLRTRIAEAAVAAARAAGYVNAGTVEFLIDRAGEFYFLEVNTRLQVEHPVTELVTGRDLVHAQLRIAAGEPLPFRQSELRQSGHAIECRVYAEDPDRGFLPDTGVLSIFRPPSGAGVRVDSGVREGDEVSVHYDPLLAKLIVHAGSRAAALDRMEWALARFPVLGVTTNLQFLRALLRHPAFRAGELHTGFLEQHRVSPGSPPPGPEVLAAAALAASPSQAPGGTMGTARIPSPWLEGGAWRLGAGRRETA